MAENTQNPSSNLHSDQSAAAELIRAKLNKIYQEEPDAKQELAESKAVPRRSKHQEFMYRLGTSGKDLATIQTEWHNYYANLSGQEKHQVWQEFYASQSAVTGQKHQQAAHPAQVAQHKHEAARPAQPKKLKDSRSKQEIRQAIRHKVTAGGKLQAKHHLQSLLFGLGVGCIVLVLFLFSFFNEVIIAPFIQPGRSQTSTPIILGDGSNIASDTPQVIIPKINVQIPTDFSAKTTNESEIEAALDRGVVHYPTTVKPGEVGNSAFFGHSSNNLFNKGKYKFAFVLLHTIEVGDTFYLTYGGKTYVYRVFDKKVVEPHQVDVLNPVAGHPSTATLITCDPPGTSLRRLVVIADQISPDPVANTATTTTQQTVTPATDGGITLPGNGQTLGGRLLSITWLRAVLALAAAVATIFLIVKAPKLLRHARKRSGRSP